MTPDWAAKPTNVPYANFGNPQSLNLYSYVQNNPTTVGDPDGHCPQCAVAGVVVLGAATATATIVGGAFWVGSKIIESHYEEKRDASFRKISAENRQLLAQKAQKQQQQQQQQQAEETKEESPEPQASSDGAMQKGGNNGTIYRVPGEGTKSGKPYIGRHNKPNPAKTRRSRDGRDRTKAEVVDTYNASNTQEGKTKEQQQIDKHGLKNLDNKRNEIRKKKPKKAKD
jgi:hypothetical protein